MKETRTSKDHHWLMTSEEQGHDVRMTSGWELRKKHSNRRWRLEESPMENQRTLATRWGIGSTHHPKSRD